MDSPTSASALAQGPPGPHPTLQQADTSSRTLRPCSQRLQDLAPPTSGPALDIHIDIYGPNIGEPKYKKKILTDIKKVDSKQQY